MEVSVVLSPPSHAAMLGHDFDYYSEQVAAPFLLTLRIANGTALQSEQITTGGVASIRFFRSQGQSMLDSPILHDHDQHPASPMGVCGVAPEGPGANVENVIEEVPL